MILNKSSMDLTPKIKETVQMSWMTEDTAHRITNNEKDGADGMTNECSSSCLCPVNSTEEIDYQMKFSHRI